MKLDHHLYMRWVIKAKDCLILSQFRTLRIKIIVVIRLLGCRKWAWIMSLRSAESMNLISNSIYYDGIQWLKIYKKKFIKGQLLINLTTDNISGLYRILLRAWDKNLSNRIKLSKKNAFNGDACIGPPQFVGHERICIHCINYSTA